MPRIRGIDRVNAINADIVATGGIASSGGTSGSSGSSGGGTNPDGSTWNNNYVSTNPHDAPGYNPATDPTSSAYGRTATPTQPITPTVTSAPTSAITPTISQTAPNNAQVNAPNAQVTPGAIQATPEQVAAVASATQQVADLQSRYKQGLATAKASGQDPTSQGAATVGVQANLQTPQIESPSVIGGIIETDSNFDSILTMYDDFMSPQSQKVSLLDEYNKLSGSLGIQAMNAELIDARRIINGTEDDVRSEITAAGGLATDSQVLALANARNKSLIKNYNYLLESRDNATTQLTTMMNLSVQDRQMASAEFDRKMNFAFKVAEFKQKATDNARTGLQWAIENGGGSEILKSPYETRLVEKTLGLPTGGLAGIVAKQNKPDLQFISGTENQASGVFDKTTGKFIPYGGYGVGGGGGISEDAQSWATNIQNKTATLGDVPAKLKTDVSKILASQPKQMGAAATNMTSIINGLVDNPNLKYATGLTGALPNWMTYGGEAFNIKKQADQVKNMLALENRQSLKGQGTVSDFEGRMLASAATTLSSGLTSQAYEQELRKIRGFVQVMNGNPIEVRIINPKTGEFQFTQVDEAGLEAAINDGAVIEYQ